MGIWKMIRLGSNRKLPRNFISTNSIGKTKSIYHIWEVKKTEKEKKNQANQNY